jgi:hypothetical protein
MVLALINSPDYRPGPLIAVGAANFVINKSSMTDPQMIMLTSL